MKDKENGRWKAAWLALALLLLFLAGGDRPLGLAVWLAPVFLLRFFRLNRAFKAYLVALPLMVAADLIADRGMTPFPSFPIQLAHTALGVAIGLIPYLLDRLLGRSLPLCLRIFFLPSLAVAIPFAVGSFGSWGAMANGINDLAWLQLLSLTGTAGISFLIYWTASVLNETWERKASRATARILGVALAAVLMLAYGFGRMRLRASFRPDQTVLAAGISCPPAMREELLRAFAVLVRADPAQPEKMAEIRDSMTRQFRKLLDDSAALADGGFAVIAWPEAAAVLFADDERSLIESAAREARKRKIHLGVSVAVYQKESGGHPPGIRPLFKNKLILVSPRGTVEWEYAKSILVPGMEAAISIPGDRIMKVSSPPLRATGAICYEMDFPAHIRQAASLKAGLILAPSNDWEAIKNTHARMARLRAIETGVSLLRPTSGGVAIAADPFGRILSRVDAYASPGAPLTAAIPIGPVRTFYGRWGDWLPWLCLILALASLTLSFMNRITRSKTGREP